MTRGIVDTNILIETFRRTPDAGQWIQAQSDLAITSITWLEFMEGAPGKAGQIKSLSIMKPFELLLLTESDQW